MNKNVMIVLGGAVLVAVLMAVLVQMMMAGPKEEKVAVKEEPKVEILVAAKAIGVGNELGEKDLKWQVWPKGTLFPGAIVRKDEQKAEEALQGRLRRNMSEGEPLMATYVLGGDKLNFVAASLEPGQRAVAIKVSAEAMVAGFVSPGDHVDVVLTYKQKIKVEDDDPIMKELVREGIDSLATEIILGNVKVLAIDQTAQRPDSDKVKVGKTVTLALSVEETEKVILAQQVGNLTLVLRGVGDEAPVVRKWPITSDKRIVNVDDEIFEEYLKLKNQTGIQADNVRIYNGGDVQVIPMR